ncbi:MAG: Cro/Cl family transcriptional regulator [Desulfuromonas sp.]|nr:MAG: Cro/Cl family transcriptional regulator [Desulfuromonas sp.]
MKKYLEPSRVINFDDPAVAELAEQLAQGAMGENDIVRRCFEFVRDKIKHSWDYKLNPVTCRAADVLLHGTGYCYAKSHLLAALLRKNGIPTGLCYQRLPVNDSGAPYCLHGLNAVYLAEYGWYRIDARGNKANVNAQFSPPLEALAFPIQETHACDLPEIWSEPLPVVTDVLERYDDIEQVFRNLPDIQLLNLK